MILSSIGMIARLFLSTPSVRRATQVSIIQAHAVHISIHALRAEGDIVAVDGCGGLQLFLSTPSVRRATLPAA